MGGRGRNGVVSKGGERRRDKALRMCVVGGKGRKGDGGGVEGRRDGIGDREWA